MDQLRGQNINKLAIFFAAVNYQGSIRETPFGFQPPSGFEIVANLDAPRFPLVGFILESRNEIIIAFRGTRTYGELFEEIMFEQVPFPFVPDSGSTSVGFTRIYQGLRNDLFEVLRNLSPNKKLFITGHSLGGALATLAAVDIAANTHFRDPIVSTYGSPRVGNPQFVMTYRDLVDTSVRVANLFDAITYLPRETIQLRNIRYEHVPELYLIRFQSISPPENHRILNYFRALCLLNKEECIIVCKENEGLCPPIH